MNKFLETKDAPGKMEQKDFSFELKELKDDGTFSGYASVFNQEDQGADIVMPGAFQASINDIKARKKTLPMLWAHDSRIPIGGYTELREDTYGLWCEGKFTKGVVKADETHALMKDGVIDGLSIGYRTEKYEIDNSDPDKYVRRLQQVKLFEISVVTFPMLDIARVTDVKALENIDERELERLLRGELNLTGGQAVSAVAIMKKHLQREVGREGPAREASGMNELMAAIRESRTTMNS